MVSFGLSVISSWDHGQFMNWCSRPAPRVSIWKPVELFRGPPRDLNPSPRRGRRVSYLHASLLPKHTEGKSSTLTVPDTQLKLPFRTTTVYRELEGQHGCRQSTKGGYTAFRQSTINDCHTFCKLKKNGAHPPPTEQSAGQA